MKNIDSTVGVKILEAAIDSLVNYTTELQSITYEILRSEVTDSSIDQDRLFSVGKTS